MDHLQRLDSNGLEHTTTLPDEAWTLEALLRENTWVYRDAMELIAGKAHYHTVRHHYRHLSDHGRGQN